MLSSTNVQPTSTSRRCETTRLVAGVVHSSSIAVDERREMYALLETYFSGTTRLRFEADLREKEKVILLRDGESGRICGFSTLMRMRAEIDGQHIEAFFSGDTKGAISGLTEANRFFHNRKFSFTLMMLRVAPRLLLRAYDLRDRLYFRMITKY